tara:strand:+ start:4445 stop:5593 length:1149 start_codon:yes stop_codon:yes gene_type:complete
MTFFLSAQNLYVKKIQGKYKKPVYLTASKKIFDTIFIVEQIGRIQAYKQNIEPTIFLDIQKRVHQPRMPGDERGLLGMALHPNFHENGKFYVNYINHDDVTIISSFTSSITNLNVDISTEEIILKIEQPYSNHNGGQLAFGIDGYLYIGVGDGGYAGDPKLNGQNITTLFGSILRIDIDSKVPYAIPEGNPFYNHKTAKGEIFCYGLRNPWRFSFDYYTGDLFIADVGQNNWEEINFLPYKDASGSNFGWNTMEGSHCYPPNSDCKKNNLIIPIFEYPNNANYIKTLIGWDQNKAQGCSVTGGYVYRGAAINKLKGKYIFGDYCTGKIWSFEVLNNKATKHIEWKIKGMKEDLYLSSFGQDGQGELYLLNHTGNIYQIINGK